MRRYSLLMNGRACPPRPAEGPVIFIGHSHIRPESGEQGAVSAVTDHLRGLGFTVAVDFELQAQYTGDDYRREIRSWTSRCQAALLVFTPVADPSQHWDWLVKEAAHLEGRLDAEPDLPVIPVFAEGLRAKSVLDEHQWRTVGYLRDRRRLDLASPELLPDLRTRLDPIVRLWDSETDLRAKQAVLSSLRGMDVDAVRRSLAQLATAPEVLSLPPYLLTEELFRLRDHAALGRVLGPLADTDRGAALEILDWVLPHTWIEEPQGQVVPDACWTSLPKPGIATQTSTDDTCTMLVRRGLGSPPHEWSWFSVPVLKHADVASALLAEARTGIAGCLVLDGPMEDAELADELAIELLEYGRPCFMVLENAPDPEALRPLRETFEHLHLIFKNTSPEQLTALGLAEIVNSVQPPLALEQEDKVVKWHRRTSDRLSRIRQTAGSR